MLPIFLLVTAVCVDAFAVSLAYGANHIKIPLKSAVVIAGIGTFFLSISILAAGAIEAFVSPFVCRTVSFGILFFMGIGILLQDKLKNLVKRKKQLHIKKSAINNMLEVYLDETKADFDKSMELTTKEALYLAVALSLDSLIAGLGGGMEIYNRWMAILSAFFVGLFAVLGGSYIGKKVANKVNIDLSYISGTLLIILAFMRVI